MIPIVALPPNGMDFVQCGICFTVIHTSRVDDHDLWHTAIDTESVVDATVEPQFEITDRGFKRLASIPGVLGGRTRIYESSNAMHSCIWLATDELNDLNGPHDGPVHTAHIELTIENAAALRDQLNWIITNHYQAEA